VALSDFAAHGALLAFRWFDKKIPEELIMAGFANEPFTVFVNPSLTSIDQSTQEMGYSSAKILVDEIENKGNTVEEKNVIIQSKLIIRQSPKK
jgi:LacI family transcriptional regulator